MAQSEASAMMQVGACSLGCANRVAAARASLMVLKVADKIIWTSLTRPDSLKMGEGLVRFLYCSGAQLQGF